jgi:hypothetical protein
MQTQKLSWHAHAGKHVKTSMCLHMRIMIPTIYMLLVYSYMQIDGDDYSTNTHIYMDIHG